MSTTCKSTVYVQDEDHTNDPYSPTACRSLAKADCRSRNSEIAWIDFCLNKVNTGGWTDEDEGICYITYKCQGCNYFCR